MKETERNDLVGRTKRFALQVIRLYSELPKSTPAQVLGKQLLRSGTSVGAQYREAQRAKSVADFVSKAEGALQELEESSYWLDLLRESGNGPSKQLDPLISETEQLISIFVTIVKAAKSRRDNR